MNSRLNTNKDVSKCVERGEKRGEKRFLRPLPIFMVAVTHSLFTHSLAFHYSLTHSRTHALNQLCSLTSRSSRSSPGTAPPWFLISRRRQSCLLLALPTCLHTGARCHSTEHECRPLCISSLWLCPRWSALAPPVLTTAPHPLRVIPQPVFVLTSTPAHLSILCRCSTSNCHPSHSPVSHSLSQRFLFLRCR